MPAASIRAELQRAAAIGQCLTCTLLQISCSNKLVFIHVCCRGKGRLVVTASMAAKVPSPGQAVYSAAKMAVWGYFGSLATEVADK